MAKTVNIPSQIVVQTAAQWAADATVYTSKRILVTSDSFYGATDQRKFKIADGSQTWAQLDYFPVSGYDDATSSIQTQLNSKGSRYTKLFQWALSATIADNTIYIVTNIASLTLGNFGAGAQRNMKFGVAGTLKEVSFTTTIVNTPTNELVTMYLRNVTTATDYQIDTFNLNIGASSMHTFLFTGLSIAVNTTDDYCIKFLTPTWVTNVSSWYGAGEMYIL